MFISRRMDEENRVHIQQYVNAMMNPITIYANLFLRKGHTYKRTLFGILRNEALAHNTMSLDLLKEVRCKRSHVV